MKYILTLLLFIISLPLFSQKNDTATTGNNRSGIPLSPNEIYGYIDGVRLDSISSLFATFGFSSKQTLTFDYGQNWIDTRRYAITDSLGKPLRLSNTSVAMVLSFFHFNHWDYISNYQKSASQYGNVSSPVLKKW